MMKLRKGDRRVYSKFAEVRRVNEKEFYGIGSKNEFLTVTAEYLGQAKRLLEQDAKEKGIELTLVRVFNN